MPVCSLTSRLAAVVVALVVLFATAATATAQVSKGHQILIEQGLQIQGMVAPYDPFHFDTYQAANYTSVNWIWDSRVSDQGPAPGAMPWSRWVRNRSEMPPLSSTPFGPDEGPYMSKLFALQIGDEANLDNQSVRDDYVNWYNEIRTANPSWLQHTMLWNNNFGGQVSDAALGDFISRAKPDIIGFDTYPYTKNETTGAPTGPPNGSPWTWYSDMRRYRQHALGAGIPFSVYRQTFHDNVIRDPSQSEMRLQTYAALAYGAKVLTDFTYNTGASSLFDNTAGGDNSPNARYALQADINRRARNLGPALVRLNPIHDLRPKGAGEAISIFTSDDPNYPAGTTTNIMMLRGRFGAATTDVNPLPIGLMPDPQAPNTNSWWEFGKNDPYLTGWTRTNLGNVNPTRPGDVTLAWFKPVDPQFDNPSEYDDQLYFMVVNGITSPDENADTRQRITLDFFKTDATFRGIYGSENAPGNFPGLLMLDSNTGQVVQIPISTTQLPGTLWSVDASKWRLTLELNGGEGMLFQFGSDPSSFIHLVPEPACLALLPLASLLMLRQRRPRPPR